MLLVFLVHDVIKHFIFPVLFQTTTFEMQRYLFSAYRRHKIFSFSHTFSNHNIWNAMLLVFPCIFPVLFQTTTFEISVTCFSSWIDSSYFNITFLCAVCWQKKTTWHLTNYGLHVSYFNVWDYMGIAHHNSCSII